MKKLLILSFDLIRPGESAMPLAMGSILSYLKMDAGHNVTFTVDHHSVNMLAFEQSPSIDELTPLLLDMNLHEFDFIALSAYIWNEYLTRKLMQMIREKTGFHGAFILGGYQISYTASPEREYPEASYFIQGYAEESLLSILKGTVQDRRINIPLAFEQIPSPYLNGIIPIAYGQERVRLETKRGCPYRCSFCAHRDLTHHKVYHQHLDKVFQEIALFQERGVRKINVLDPIFNAGREYPEIMAEMLRIKLKALVSFQARFETITGTRGVQFLDACSELNVELEFGLQTAIREESELIDRKNQPQKIQAVMHQLNERKIPYEVSLIYGLPGQTLDSFRRSIDFVRENGCQRVVAFPLMLLKGTKLYTEKDKYGFQEGSSGEFHIPVVTSSHSFSRSDWEEMGKIAAELGEGERV
ncbi:MAG: B12-binding domain-containing radical SAM protein [Bacteroidota bacterium]